MNGPNLPTILRIFFVPLLGRGSSEAGSSNPISPLYWDRSGSRAKRLRC
jgi:hypothetical protein